MRLEDVHKLTVVGSGRLLALEWEDDVRNRYHLWLDPNTRRPGGAVEPPAIIKYPPEGVYRGRAHDGKRRIDAQDPIWLPLVEKLLERAEAEGLFNRAAA